MSKTMKHGWAAEWKIDLTPLDFEFSSKPIVIGGKSMEYYGLRQAGRDIDLVITNEDYQRLASQYPEFMKEIWSDLGVCVHGFEIWRSIALYDYDYFLQGAIEEGNCFVISFDKLLFTRLLAKREEKYARDLDLIIDRMVYSTMEERMKYLAATSLDELVAKSELIAIGTVVEQQVSEHKALVYTRSTIRVEETWKADGNQTPTMIKVIQTGGTLGKYVTEPFKSAPLLKVGKHYLLFAHKGGDDYYVMGMRQGMAEIRGGVVHHQWPHDAVCMQLDQIGVSNLRERISTQLKSQ